MRQGRWLFALLAAAPLPVFAAGFDKSIPWSGKYAGLGGSTAAIVEGAQSLAFNPAGLVAAPGGFENPEKWELSLQFSPTFSQFRGPIATNQQLTSDTGFSPIGAILAGYRPTPWLGLGLGGFVVAGLNADYKNVDFSAVNPNFDTLKPEFKSYLQVIDLSAGAAVDLGGGFRAGAAYRVSLVSADLFSANAVPAPAGSPAGTPPVALVSARLTDLTDTRFNGFRVGLQYAPKNLPFSAGVAWRTPVSFSADGTARGAFESGTTAGPSADLPGSTATVSSELPSQISAGLAIKPVPTLLVVGEYVFTNYSIIHKLDIKGSLQGPKGPIPLTDLPLEWDNQHNARVGVQWSGLGPVDLRAGYVWTSRVTNKNLARATLAIPGSANTVTLGAGSRVAKNIELDGAFEFSWGTARGTTETGVTGLFEERGAVAHLGATVLF